MKPKLNYLILLTVCTLAISTLKAQEVSTKKHEFGILASSIDYFGFIYKKGIDDKSKLRISSTSFNISADPITNRLQNNIGIVVGYEKLKKLSEKVSFTQGPELGFSASQRLSTNNGDYRLVFSPRLFYFVGLQYDISEHFYFGAEVRPALQANLSFENGNDFVRDLDFSLNINSRLRLHLVYIL